MKLEWSDDALADLDRFAEFLHKHHPRLAAIVADEIITKAQILSKHPQLGRPITGREEYRQIVLQVLNAAYVFQYRYDKEPAGNAARLAWPRGARMTGFLSFARPTGTPTSSLPPASAARNSPPR